MKKPIVAIVGKPNVGKSTFFNKVVGRRISIVDDMAGVTRDRIFGSASWCGYAFTLIDTGGLDFTKDDEINKNILEQANLAVEVADIIVFMVDGREGLTAQDKDVANYLRKAKAPKVLVVNKLDNFEVEKTYDFYDLGLGQPFAVSVEHGKGVGDVLDEIINNIKQFPVEKDNESIKLALVGKPNAGKSSLTNLLLGEKRVAVSSVAGTTRDAIEVPFRYNGKNYTIIDTAGLRKKSKIEPSSIEKYSTVRSLDAISRCDVALLVIDASVGITEQDVRIAGLIHEQGKPSVIVVNKWDLIEKNNNTMQEFKKKLSVDLAFMSYFIPVFISCTERQRVGKVMETVEKVYENSSREIAMGLFNNVLTNAISVTQPPYRNGKRLKITFGKQSGTNPPTFSIYCNDASLIDNSYLRYLENSLRKAFNFTGTPIKINFKNKGED